MHWHRGPSSGLKPRRATRSRSVILGGAAGSTGSQQAGCDLLHFQPQTRMLPDPIFQRFAWAVPPAFANCGEPDFQGRRLRPDQVSLSRAGAARGG